MADDSICWQAADSPRTVPMIRKIARSMEAGRLV
jgi:hypothetical protein